ncbi:MAG TPA: outer membrane lipoprotein carrier protein LolA [Cytophagaceae bacterium]|jgi:outer membrane lipoprotein-sorting protein
MKKIAGLLLLLISTINILVAQYDPKALAILDAMSKKYKSIPSFKAKFVYSLESPASGVNESSEGEIIVKGGKFILKLSGQEIINNGTTVWTYLKEANEVNISDYTPDDDDITPTKIYTMYKKGYKYTFLEERMDAGKPVEVVDLIPEDKKNQLFKVRLEINKKDKTIKGWKVFEKNGNRYNYSVKNFSPDFKAEDNIFTFDKTKYKGVEVIDLR